MSYKCIQDINDFTGTVIFDIRDEVSYQSGSIPNSIHLDKDKVNDFINTTDHETPILIYCYRGIQSRVAAEYFVIKGFQTVYSLDGGYTEYERG